MKSSKKILIAIAGVIIAFLIAGVIILRNDVQALIAKTESKYNYKKMPVDNFEALDFSAHWDVKIRQGRNYEVEVATKDISPENITLESIQGTLYFKIDTVNQKNVRGIHAKITTPALKSIKAVGNTRVQLQDFKTDSINIILKDSVTFIGDMNKIKNTSFESSGDVSVQILDNPDM